MKPVHLIILLSLTLTIATCTDSGEVLAPEVQQLWGSWQWIKSIGGFGGETLTPLSTGMAVVIEFQSDGITSTYANGNLVQRIRYNIQKDRPSSTQPESYFIQYEAEGAIRQLIRYRGLDTLQLIDGCCDGYENTYARIAN